MGSMSIMHWLIVVAVVLLLFGRGKIPELMGDVANGIKSFKKGMQEDEPDAFKPGDTKEAQIDMDHQKSIWITNLPRPSRDRHTDRMSRCEGDRRFT